MDGCNEDRCRALEIRDAIVVWDLDPVCLTKILKFYLNHMQPTWRNQIISDRNIWISNKRPTDKAVEAKVCGNLAVQNLEKYLVSFFNSTI